MLGLDGEDALLQVQGDVLLVEAGQLSLQQELVALVPDVGPEGGQGGVGVVEELLFEVVKEIEDVVVTAVKGNHAEHSVTLLLHHLLWAVPGGSRAGRVYEICNLEAGVLAVSPDVSGNLLSTVDILLRFYE